MNPIIIKTNNCSREDYDDLINYLREKSWDFGYVMDAPIVDDVATATTSSKSIDELKDELNKLSRADKHFEEKSKEIRNEIEKLIDQKMNSMNLTPMERIVLQNLIDNLYAEECFSDVDVPDLAYETEIGVKSVRGVVSSLIKKGIVHVSEAYNDVPPLVYLSDTYWDLHPRWQKKYG